MCTSASSPQCKSLTTVASTYYRCTDFSASEDWSMGENSFNYTFPFTGEWSVRYVLVYRDDLRNINFFQLLILEFSTLINAVSLLNKFWSSL